eukprot:TRINITY_DN6892_c0_g5_i1.p1 TRINITY_DN6892_c0_g5~~TRINITY_DN6892_c0_g5_i1.p1  ORF type:complete len:216 (+),score=-16.03 TRINITY_DN6892_c0_g5_i1:132-779(+)
MLCLDSFNKPQKFGNGFWYIYCRELQQLQPRISAGGVVPPRPHSFEAYVYIYIYLKGRPNSLYTIHNTTRTYVSFMSSYCLPLFKLYTTIVCQNNLLTQQSFELIDHSLKLDSMNDCVQNNFIKQTFWQYVQDKWTIRLDSFAVKRTTRPCKILPNEQKQYRPLNYVFLKIKLIFTHSLRTQISQQEQCTNIHSNLELKFLIIFLMVNSYYCKSL